MAERSGLILVGFITFFVNVLMLSNYNSVYWDDWAIYQQDFSTIKNMFNMAGGVYGGWFASYLHISLLTLGVFSYRFFLLVLFIVCSLSLYKILSDFKSLSSIDKVFICAIFASLPYFEVSHYLINFIYTFCYALFIFAFYLYVRWQGSLTFYNRVFILALFFLSYFVNSLVSFYGLFLMFLLFKELPENRSFCNSVGRLLRHKLDFLLLPFAFILLKFTLFIPNGLYDGYNDVGLGGFSLTKLVNGYYLLVLDNFLRFSKRVLEVFFTFWWLIVPLGIVISRVVRDVSNIERKTCYLLLFFGVLALILGGLPYIVVDKIPVLEGVNSRFQLLLPIAFSLICYSLMSLVFSGNFIKLRNFALVSLILSMSIMKFDGVIKYHLDWLYQNAVIEALANSEKVNDNSTFIYRVNASGTPIRPISYYAINGLSTVAFGEPSKLFAYDATAEGLDNISRLRDYKQYNFSNWVHDRLVRFTIVPGEDYSIGTTRLDKVSYIVRMRYLELFNVNEFKREVMKMIRLDFD